MNTAKAKNFEFDRMVDNWVGYISSTDKTNLPDNVLVEGSLNVYKKLSGNIAVRPGQKRIGEANATVSPVSSEYVWNTSWGRTYVLWVSDGKLQVKYEDTWYDLQTGVTDTRYVFDTWFYTSEFKDRLLFVNGNPGIMWWSGGIATVASSTAVVSGVVYFARTAVGGVVGSGYAVGDVLTITGGGGSGATFEVTAVDTSGGVTSLTMLTGGSGYTAGNNNATSGGSGTGCQVQTLITSGGTITKTDSSVSWQEAGFTTTSSTQMATTNSPTAKSIVIEGVQYTYRGGETTDTLFGVNADPSGITPGSAAVQAVITQTDTPAADFDCDFIKVINNQVYVGSYTSRLIFMSSNTDFSYFTVPTPQLPGSAGLFVLDGTARGIGVRQGNACVGFGANGWAVISFQIVSNNNILTRNNKIDIKPVAVLQAPLAHEFIDNVGDNLVYLAQDHQLRQFGDYNNLFVAGYPSISQEVATELAQEDFEGGGIKCIGEFIYITAPNSGKVYLRQERTRVDDSGNIVAERLWHAPFVWNATRIDQINGTVVAFSNANPQMYQVWDTNQWYDDSPSDEELPYNCVAAFSYRGKQRRQGLWSFDKQFTEGYITPGTPLSLTINYNWNGATNIITAPINSDSRPAYMFQGISESLGDSSLGESSLGEGGLSSGDTLVKFKTINSLSLINCFEWQPIYFSNSANSNWEILAVSTNASVESQQDATFIINK